MEFSFLSAFSPKFSGVAYGMNNSESESLNSKLVSEISRLYGGASVELIGDVRWTRGSLPQKINSVNLIFDDSKGNINFSVSGEFASTQDNNTKDNYKKHNYTKGNYKDDQVRRVQYYSEGWISFASWTVAKVSTRRVRPGEPINSNYFISQKINLATGLAHEYRGVIISADSDLSRLEATQTILEGQFLMSSAVQRSPDIRRGDSIRIHLVSGELTLTTTGFAEEPGYLDKQIRVMTTKSKRELSGLLQEGGIVEVKL